MEKYKCKKCGIVKSIDKFQPTGTKLGHKQQCRECWAKYMRNYYKSNPKKYSRHKKYVSNNDAIYKSQYYRHGIDKKYLTEMFDKYGGACHSCKEQPATQIDHDHKCCPGAYSCGQCVRGILCGWCNSALGHIKDSKENLYKLIDYLDFSRQ